MQIDVEIASSFELKKDPSSKEMAYLLLFFLSLVGSHAYFHHRDRACLHGFPRMLIELSLASTVSLVEVVNVLVLERLLIEANRHPLTLPKTFWRLSQIHSCPRFSS